jgi:hypothetical protein
MNRNTRRQVGPPPAASLHRVGTALEPFVPPHSCLTKWDFALPPALLCVVQLLPPPHRRRHTRPRGIRQRVPCPAPRLATLSQSHGALPVEVPLPPVLRILDLSGNSFSSAIPGSLFTKEHYLSRNAFSGRIPPQIASLTSLTWLELYHNVLSRNLSRLGAMRVLYCRWCLSWRAATPPARCAARRGHPVATPRGPRRHTRAPIAAAAASRLQPALL